MLLRLGLVSIVLVVVGCRDDDPRGAPVADRPTGAERPADEALAEHALLTLADLPGGWSEASRGESESQQDGRSRELIAPCLGLDPDEPRQEVPSAESPRFESVERSASAVIVVDATAGAANDLFDRLLRPGVDACIEDAFRTFATERAQGGGMTIDDVRLTSVDFPTFGDEIHVWELTATLQIGEVPLEDQTHIITIRVGRATATLQLTSLDGSFDRGELEAIAERQADRLAEAF